MSEEEAERNVNQFSERTDEIMVKIGSCMRKYQALGGALGSDEPPDLYPFESFLLERYAELSDEDRKAVNAILFDPEDLAADWAKMKQESRMRTDRAKS